MSSVGKIVIVSASLVLFSTRATPANNSEQVVFSGQGFVMTLAGNTKATSTPFGFWIWCAAEAAPQGRGGYQLANACQGSMYFLRAQHSCAGSDWPGDGRRGRHLYDARPRGDIRRAEIRFTDSEFPLHAAEHQSGRGSGSSELFFPGSIHGWWSRCGSCQPGGEGHRSVIDTDAMSASWCFSRAPIQRRT
jgi:hypothetical protein